MDTTPTPGAVPASSTSPPSADLVFGRYQIIRRLAIGGMGEVFLARQSGVAGFDRLVILKSLLPDLAAQEDFVHQFLDEARVAATLNHPNIVSIYEVGLWNGTYFIAMEYIRGDNLSRLARAAGRAKSRMPLNVAAFIVHDAAQALDHAHKACDLQGQPLTIVHRDVSPQNIMVRTDGVTKVVDFGIAKAANRSSRTATGLLKGKVQYMAPEQVAGAQLDGRTDQFALGVVLWELIAGRKLFTGDNDIEILRAVLQSRIPLLVEVEPSCPAELSGIVQRMLEREVAARYPTLAEAAAALKAFLDARGMKNAQQATAEFVADTLGEEISAKTIDLTPSSANNFVINLSQSERPPTAPTVGGVTPSKARLGIAVGAGLAVLLAAGMGALMLLPGATPPPTREAAVPSPKIAVDAQPAGATVKIDGTEVGKAPITVEVTPDIEHVVEISHPGHEPRVEKVALKAGDMRGVMAMLQRQKTKLKVVTNLAGAIVKIDDREVGTAPLEVEVEAERAHSVWAGLDKGKEKFRYVGEVTGKPGEVIALALRLDKQRGLEPCAPGTSRVGGRCVAAASAAPSVEAGKGFLTVKTTPWAKIAIDGQPAGSTPVARIPLAAGAHTVRLVNEEAGKDVVKKVMIKAGETLKQDWQL